MALFKYCSSQMFFLIIQTGKILNITTIWNERRFAQIRGYTVDLFVISIKTMNWFAKKNFVFVKRFWFCNSKIFSKLPVQIFVFALCISFCYIIRKILFFFLKFLVKKNIFFAMILFLIKIVFVINFLLSRSNCG